MCPGVLCSGLFSSVVPTANSYADIESTVASLVGQIEVYMVHHHGSKYSSNTGWLSTTTPKVGIISMGTSNTYGHPTADALGRLHAAGVKTYWTSAGNGAAPSPGQDVIAGNTIIEASPGATTFTVRYGGTTDTFNDWGATGGFPAGPPFGSFDTPVQNAIIAGEVGVTGWALDNLNVNSVKIYRSLVAGEGSSLVFIGDATFISGARPMSRVPTPTTRTRLGPGGAIWSSPTSCRTAGMGLSRSTPSRPTTRGTLSRWGNERSLRPNATSAIPFGTIDTPAQGATASGTIVNFGWALTPQPGMIPIDGSTITVYIDNVPLGHPSYNVSVRRTTS